MEIEKSQFQLKLAETENEVRAAQRLRYRVFVEEMGAPAADADHDSRLEQDRFDPYFDHLILIDREVEDPLENVAGVYRILRGEVARNECGFYSASEYDLHKIEALDCNVIELGRSCVDQKYRGGVAMHLLWNGLGAYVLENDIQILFGTASFHGSDPDKIKHALARLYHNNLAPEELRVSCLPDSRAEMNLMAVDEVDRVVAAKQTPALIKAYLRLGGFVGDGAYIDYDFNTIDVCLLMDTERMGKRYLDFYRRGQGMK